MVPFQVHRSPPMRVHFFLQSSSLRIHSGLEVPPSPVPLPPPPPPAGTIMQHWMELWKERGRPNRGAELLLFQEATLQFLQQHRQG